VRGLVAGGAGFIGPHSADRLRGLGLGLGHGLGDGVAVIGALMPPVHRGRPASRLNPEGAIPHHGTARHKQIALEESPRRPARLSSRSVLKIMRDVWR
jgi:nucleoside-diphosphate-sugar epimerase